MSTAKNFFNPNRDMVTIFTPEGEEHECTRLNARELVASRGFTWKKTEGASSVEQDAPAEASEPAPTPEPTPEPKPEPEKGEEPNVDHVNDPLSKIASDIAGTDDVAKYLEGFTADALRTMSEERYEEKLHHKLGKDKVIDKIIGFEEKKLATEYDQ